MALADADFADEMQFCLLCRHCESVCPAGVNFGAMMEHTRGALRQSGRLGARERILRWLGFRLVLPRRWAVELAAMGLRLLQSLKLTRLVRLLGAHDDGLPLVPPRAERRPLPASIPASGERRARAQLLEGCVMPALFGAENRATAKVLSALGVELELPRTQTCCGSLHAHNGELEEARRLARMNLDAFGSSDAPIVVNSAGCASHMKELFQLFESDDPDRARAEAFAARVQDFAEFTAPLAADESTPFSAAALALPQPVAWDSPCHLCHGQRVRAQPHALLDLVAELERVPLEAEEDCCGSAGIYSILRPEESRAILEPKLDALVASGARTLVTANPGCQLQWEAGVRARGLDVRVVHLASLLEQSLERASEP